MRDELDELSILHRRVVRTPDNDPRTQPDFNRDHAAMLGDIDGVATVLELISNWGRVGAERALTALRQLLAWGACALDDPQRATPAAELREDADAAILAEDVELDDPTKRRILAATALLREGRVLELLGVPRGAGRAELKRAYYVLAKEFHPDRFYGRRLGSYGQLLTRVFEAAAQAIKTLVDQRTFTSPGGEVSAGGPQRRRSPRYAWVTPLRMRCASWPRTLWIETREIGAGGMFVSTDQAARVGERVAFELQLPDQSMLMLSGRIVDRVPSGPRAPGLCVQFAPLSAEDRAKLDTMIDAARAGVPVPAEANGRRIRFARGSGPISTVHPIVGIDFGTTYISVSAAVDGRVHVLPFPEGARAMPSVVAFPRRGEVIVGTAARERLVRDPRHAVASVKRLLGRHADDPAIQGQLSLAGYETSPGAHGELQLEMWGEPVAIPQLCGYLLDAARRAAEDALGRPIGSAVLSAPVSFGAERVEMLRRAARMAHLDVVGVVDEPSAAALANRFRPDFGGLIGVYDFGGGTFDFSVVDATGGDFRVITTAGDSWLGGDDFDQAIADGLANLYWRANGVDLRQRAVEWQRLLVAVERAKRDLSVREETELVVPEVAHTVTGTSDLTARIQRHQVERIWRSLIERSLDTCLQTLTLVGLAPRDLSAVYLSGGTTHIPLVREALHRYFGTAPITGVPADYAVCLGAGIHAAQLEQLRDPTLGT